MASPQDHLLCKTRQDKHFKGKHFSTWHASFRHKVESDAAKSYCCNYFIRVPKHPELMGMLDYIDMTTRGAEIRKDMLMQEINNKKPSSLPDKC